MPFLNLQFRASLEHSGQTNKYLINVEQHRASFVKQPVLGFYYLIN